MATYVAGNTITIWVPLVDAAGDPITTAGDADFSESIDHEATDGTLTAATVAAWAHRNNGRYYATISNAQAGKYSGTIVYNGTPKQPFSWEADVITAAQADPVAASGLTAARAAKLDRIGTSVVQVSTPVADGNDIRLQAGDDYLDADDRALAWTFTSAPDLTSATAKLLRIRMGAVSLDKAFTVSGAGTATQTVTAELTSTETDDLSPAKIGAYDLSCTLANGHKVTLARGKVFVTGDLA